jgi:hypothetical protein
MLQQHMFKHIVKMFGGLFQNQTRFAILFLSLVLTACGGNSEKTNPLEEPGPDGVAPRLTGIAKIVGGTGEREVFAKARNYCNLSQKVSIDQTVLVEIDASESVLPPNVTIGGMAVTMTGAHYSWSGEFELKQLDQTYLQGLVDKDEIPYEISVTDSSGMVSDLYTPTTDSDKLLFCDPETDETECACYPKDISGEWKLRQKPGAMGVGQSEGDMGDWSSTDFHLSQRDCVFDDTYTFTADPADPTKSTGSFEQEMEGWTWLENWQSGDVERCGFPQSPFDGSTQDMTYIWDTENETLTLEGKGAHIALPRVANGVENKGVPVEKVVYKLDRANDCLITLNIESGGPSPWWHFEIEKSKNPDGTDCVSGEDDSGLLPGAAPANPLFSGGYDALKNNTYGLTIKDVRKSESSEADPQPTATEVGIYTTFNVPAIYIDENDSDVYAYFDHDPQILELISDFDADVGDAFVTATNNLPIANNALTDADTVYNNALSAVTAADDSYNSVIAESNSTDDQINAAREARDDALDDVSDAYEALSSANAAQQVAEKALRDAKYYKNKLTFGTNGGFISFKGYATDGDVKLHFLIEHYEVNPVDGEFAVDENGAFNVIEFYKTDSITVTGTEEGYFGIRIPEMEEQGNSISLVIETPDKDVVITDIRVSTSSARDEMIRGPYYFNNIFSNGDPVPLGDDPATVAVETDAELGIDGNLLGVNNAWPDIPITNKGTTFMVPSIYIEDPDGDGEIENPGAYAGIGLDNEGMIDLGARPLTFGDGGKITFTASLESGTADVRFRLERLAGEFTAEPSCTMDRSVQAGEDIVYEVAIPKQADRTFKHIVLYVDTPDTEVTISDVLIESSEADYDSIPVDCGSNAALYGDKELDMTSPYGDATIDAGTDDQGKAIALYRVDSAGTDGYAGYAVNNGADPSPLIAEPAAFGTGGAITFTASIPALQQYTDAEGELIDLPNPQSSVELRFKLERESSDTPDTCKTEPSYTTDVITVSGAEQEYTIDIPIPTPNEDGEGGSFNTYQSFIMELLTADTQVQISNITLTTTPPTTDGQYERPDRCFTSPLPSQYFNGEGITADDFDGDGINDDVDPDIDNDGTPNEQEDDPETDDIETGDDYNYSLTSGKTAVFTGTYGNMGAAAPADTVQNGDQYTFPANSAHFGGWSNDNGGLNPLQFAAPVPAHLLNLVELNII